MSGVLPQKSSCVETLAGETHYHVPLLLGPSHVSQDIRAEVLGLGRSQMLKRIRHWPAAGTRRPAADLTLLPADVQARLGPTRGTAGARHPQQFRGDGGVRKSSVRPAIGARRNAPLSTDYGGPIEASLDLKTVWVTANAEEADMRSQRRVKSPPR